MIIEIDLKGATSLVANIPVSNLEYAQDVINFFEKNVVAVRMEYSDATVVQPESVLKFGDSVRFNGNEWSSNNGNDLIVTGRSDDVIKGFVPMKPEVLVSNKRIVEKLKKDIERLETEKKQLVLDKSDLQEKIDSLKEEIDN